jgi:hypothetical protein
MGKFLKVQEFALRGRRGGSQEVVKDIECAEAGLARDLQEAFTDVDARGGERQRQTDDCALQSQCIRGGEGRM